MVNFNLKLRADGSKYEGEWHNEVQHGHGIYTDSNGETKECDWENGEPIEIPNKNDKKEKKNKKATGKKGKKGAGKKAKKEKKEPEQNDVVLDNEEHQEEVHEDINIDVEALSQLFWNVLLASNKKFEVLKILKIFFQKNNESPQFQHFICCL